VCFPRPTFVVPARAMLETGDIFCTTAEMKQLTSSQSSFAMSFLTRFSSAAVQNYVIKIFHSVMGVGLGDFRIILGRCDF
jgi:hypothetical protein